jgi:hypothetical protein
MQLHNTDNAAFIAQARTRTIDRSMVVDCTKQSAQLRERHWTMMGLSVAILVAAFLLRTRDHETVSLPGFPLLTLPELCGSRVLFGLECPGCGLTRSFIALASGNLQESFYFNRVGWLLALAVVLQIPYRGYALWELRHRISDRHWPTWCGYVLIAALVGNWLLRGLGV